MKKIIFLLVLISLVACDKKKNNLPYQKLEGLALGTRFHITYKSENNTILMVQVDSLLGLLNRSLSTYIPSSDISRINNGDTTIVVDIMFKEVFEKSNKIYKETNGSFDPTIGILVNAWGFGPGKNIENIDSIQVLKMLSTVGFDMVRIEKGLVIKKHKETYFDFNALAKGYAVDIVGRFLESRKIENYLVEIGGEIRARGISKKNIPWVIAIEKPNFDGSQSFQTKIELFNESMATSGNYRKFKIDPITGDKYAHIINPQTGFPVKSNLLSVSIIAMGDCANVDGYSTALMAMGFEKSKQFLLQHPDLKGFLIYIDDLGIVKTYATKNFRSIN